MATADVLSESNLSSEMSNDRGRRSNPGRDGSRRRVRTSPKQFELILEFMEQHPNLATSHLDAKYTVNDRKRGWAELAAFLNNKGLGVQKNADKWRKTWFDWKCNVRGKARSSAGKRSLSPLEERLVMLTGMMDTADDATSQKVHFEESQFEQGRVDGWKKLKNSAVPTLFAHNQNLRPSKPPMKRTRPMCTKLLLSCPRGRLHSDVCQLRMRKLDPLPFSEAVYEIEDGAALYCGSTGVPVTGDVSPGEGTSASMEANYGESHGEYIVPTSGASSPQQLAHVAAVTNPPGSIVLSDVRSLAEHQANVHIKEEIIETTVITEDADAGTFESIPSPAAPSPQPLGSDVPSSFVRHSVPVSSAPGRATDGDYSTGIFRKRKRTAESQDGGPVVNRKATLEMEVLLATKRKLEAEERRADAETEFYQEEKKRSMALVSLHQEERRKMAALADFHVEERRKAAAKADLLLEHKNMYFEQQKTEVVRRRLLLLEIQKVRRELKLLH